MVGPFFAPVVPLSRAKGEVRVVTESHARFSQELEP